MERRTQERLRELANGGWEAMDPLTRRCMIVLSDELDSLHDELRRARAELHSDNADTRKDNADTRRTVIALMTAIIVAVVASGILNVAWK